VSVDALGPVDPELSDELNRRSHRKCARSRDPELSDELNRR
jgi:hypothetical protein